MRSKSNYIRSKKFIAYTVLAIIVIAVAVAYSYSIFTTPTQTNDDVTELVSESKADAAQKFASQFCGLDSSPNSSSLVIEYALPAKCEMPLAIGVDPPTGKIWYVSTKNGTLGSYDLNSATFSQEYEVPMWPSRDNPAMSSQVWDLDIDDMGNIWFTDEKQNALWRFSNHTNSFERFIVPESSQTFGTTYPVSMELDNSGKIYFVGIRSPTIWVGTISQMKNGTSDGISRIQLPLDSFKGIDPDLVSTGSIVLDKDRDILYISLLAFNTKGQILGYDLKNNTFTSYDMPKDITSPVGLALDSRGKLWVTDHGTSIFYKLDPILGNITKFTTSPASPRTLGLGTTLDAAYTLPYWIKSDSNGTLWFNEHTGNKIAKFDPINLTLTEYWIPSQNKLWGPCKNSQMQCGISNALQFDVGENNNEVWFTEWSENKIGRVLTDRETPISVSVQPRSIVLDRGQNYEIKINVTANTNTTVRMLAAGSFTTTGNLGNLSGVFSQDSFDIEPGESPEVSFIVTPTQNLEPGNYTLMVGAETDAVSVLKAVPLRIL
jgi:virginiamycin B lyase